MEFEQKGRRRKSNDTKRDLDEANTTRQATRFRDNEDSEIVINRPCSNSTAMKAANFASFVNLVGY